MKIVIALSILLFISASSVAGYFAYENYQIRESNSKKESDTYKQKNIDEIKLLEQVQAWREEGGLLRYITSPELCSFASKRLSEIKQDWSHAGFIKNNQGFQRENGFNGMAENLARDTGSELQTILSWENSPEHLKNLNADYKYTCLKCEGSYCIQEFGNKTTNQTTQIQYVPPKQEKFVCHSKRFGDMDISEDQCNKLINCEIGTGHYVPMYDEADCRARQVDNNKTNQTSQPQVTQAQNSESQAWNKLADYNTCLGRIQANNRSCSDDCYAKAQGDSNCLANCSKLWDTTILCAAYK